MTLRILHGDCRAILPTLDAQSVNCCVTSPPYFGLRDYGVEGQIGAESTPDEFVAEMVGVFREVWRVLRDDGTLWLNLGDSYAGGKQGRSDTDAASLARRAEKYGTGQGDATGPTGFRQRDVPPGLKQKDLIGIPWRVALALQAEGWYLRTDIIWHKPNPMPESVTDRPTRAHEYLFLLSKSERYYYNADAILEPFANGAEWIGRKPPVALKANADRGDAGAPARSGNPDGRNRRSVWTVATAPYSGAHFATFPPKLIEPCILAGCPVGGTVLDPFGGAGTTGLVADRLGRNAVLIELNPEYLKLAAQRVEDDAPLFADVSTHVDNQPQRGHDG